MTTRLVEHPADPGRLWIRFAPRRWPMASGRWVELTSARLAPGRLLRSPEELVLSGEPDDVVYLPPVEPAWRAARDETVRSLAARGVPALVQILPGDPVPLGGVAAVDLTECLLGAEEGAPPTVLGPEIAVWPLIAGITDRPETVERVGELLRQGGFRFAVVVPLELSPRERSELAREQGDEAFHALFHGPDRTGWELARALGRFGLEPFAPRPATCGPPAFELRRRLSGVLATAGEIRLRRGETGAGLAHYRASRLLQDSGVDPAALHREGNLRVLEWLDPASRELVETFLEGPDDPLEAMWADYLEEPEGAREKEEK